MDSLKEYITKTFSTKSVGIFILILTTIFITVILSSRYYLHHNIIENGVSKKDVIANKTVKIIDADKTQKLKNEIAKKVLPILVPIQDDFIKANLEKNLNKIDTVKPSSLSYSEKKSELTGYFNLSENDADISQIEYLLQISDAHFDNIETAANSTLNNILSKGISENDIQDNFDKIVKENITSNNYLNYADRKTVANIQFDQRLANP